MASLTQINFSGFFRLLVLLVLVEGVCVVCEGDLLGLLKR